MARQCERAALRPALDHQTKAIQVEHPAQDHPAERSSGARSASPPGVAAHGPALDHKKKRSQRGAQRQTTQTGDPSGAKRHTSYSSCTQPCTGPPSKTITSGAPSAGPPHRAIQAGHRAAISKMAKQPPGCISDYCDRSSSAAPSTARSGTPRVWT